MQDRSRTKRIKHANATSRRHRHGLGRTLAAGAIAAGVAATTSSGAAARPTLDGDVPVEGMVDISATVRGREMIERAVGRWEREGFVADPDAVVAFDLDGRGEAFAVIPPDLRVTEVSVGVDGAEVSVVRSTHPAGRGAAEFSTKQDEDGYSVRGGPTDHQEWFACWQVSQLYAENDACAFLHRALNDGDATKDHYTVEMFGTSHGKAERTWVRAKAHYDTMTWEDWSPKSDSYGNCSQQVLSVGMWGVGVSQTLERCEKWDMTKSTNDERPDMRNVWKGKTPDDREVGFLMTNATPQGSDPAWTYIANVDACEFDELMFGCG